MRKCRIFFFKTLRVARGGTHNYFPRSELESIMQRTQSRELCHLTCICRSSNIKDIFPTEDFAKKN